jgi:hypothetical protein
VFLKNKYIHMKNIQTIFLTFLAVVMLMLSCQIDDAPELGKPLSPSDISMDIIQERSIDIGGNTVILRNQTPGIVPVWDYETGKSTRQIDTVRYAFKGKYTIKRSALTAGGIVEFPDISIEVTEDNLMYVSDPLWTKLTGGPGNEKTWLLDIEGKHFDGPLYFFGTDNGWEGQCTKDADGDCWNWSPKYKDNTWLMPSGDYGTMTFKLKGGPFVTVNHLMIPSRGTENGTFYLDGNSEKIKTLSLTGATPLHDLNRDNCVAEWGKTRLFSLEENSMQLAVLRTSCEGPCLLVYNYIAKE